MYINYLLDAIRRDSNPRVNAFLEGSYTLSLLRVYDGPQDRPRLLSDVLNSVHASVDLGGNTYGPGGF